MIKFSLELGYDNFWAEGKELIEAHWNEVGTHRDILTLNPQHEVYRILENQNQLEILTARHEGKMVGYFFLLFTNHPRDVTKILAHDDIIYIKPEFRKEWAGYKFLQFALERAIARGATIAAFTEKADRNGYLKRLGFSPKETIYTKVLK